MYHFWKHFSTITRHRHKVITHCYKAGIFWQGLRHDLSKYTPAEFIPGMKYYQKGKSPNVKERELNGFSRAWLHHQGRNKHHYEYWVDYSPKVHCKKPVPMPIKYVIEMFCDRVAASKIYYGEEYTDSKPFEYFDNGRSIRVAHEETLELLEKLLVMLRDEGEEATFHYIKNVVRVEGKKDKKHWK